MGIFTVKMRGGHIYGNYCTRNLVCNDPPIHPPSQVYAHVSDVGYCFSSSMMAVIFTSGVFVDIGVVVDAVVVVVVVRPVLRGKSHSLSAPAATERL